MNQDLLVDIQELTRGYPKLPGLIFDKFNFKLFKHDFCILMGRSGVGKSTLVKFLMRQLKPYKKMIYVQNEDVAKMSDAEIQLYRRKIGVVFQDYKLINTKTVKENITYPLEIQGFSHETIKNRLNHVLDLLNLRGKEDDRIDYLSGGEKQKVSIARAIVGQPEFVIADEPTGNLDRWNSASIADILINLNKQGNTILLITHDFALVDYIKSKHSIRLFEL